ncbi:MAG: glycosyltransferase family 2 protein [Phycisphaerales bacterium]|nr:glycosyltransferase family 2 protein [Phycisphaerales bacterium]
MNGATPPGKPAIVGIEALTPQPGHNGHARVSREPWKVAAVIPCFNRRADLEILMVDLSRQHTPNIELWCVVVDNASTEPLSTIRLPAGLRVEFVRSEKNTGGSGGFNLGMSHVLSGKGLTGELGRPDFLWWVDSDARVSRKALSHLVRVLEHRPKVGAVGSAMCDISTGHMWECGGNIVPWNGRVWPAGGGDLDRRFLVKARYLAACSALVRREAIEQTGLFPENFIYYDDVDWSIQMTRRTGLKCVGAPRSRAYHPPGNRRYVTWARYYIARNCFGHMDVLKMGSWKRFRRAMLEVPRAVGQAMMGLPELAELHLKGLADARDRRFIDIEPKNVVKPVGFRPFKELGAIIEAEQAEARAAGRLGTLYVHPLLKSQIPGLEAFRRQLEKLNVTWPEDRRLWRRRNLEAQPFSDMFGAIGRLIGGGSADVALVPTGWPTNWFRARTLIQVTSEGLIVRKVDFWPTFRHGVGVFLRGLKLAAQIGLRGPHVMPLPPAPAWNPAPAPTERAPRSPEPVA